LLSLVLGVATVVLWILTHRVGQEIDVTRRRYFFGANSSAGTIALYASGRHAPVPLVSRHRQFPATDHIGFLRRSCLKHREWAGFGWGVATGSDPRYRIVVLPLWFVAALLLAPPVYRAVGLRRARRRRRTGHCASCGYDLRATPDRCPECGTVPPRAKAAAERAG
jgi:hypothetical protein